MTPTPFSFDDPAPYLHEVNVRDDDIDALGHVNNAVYLKWMDHAAYAHSAALGYDWDRYRETGAAFVVRRHEVDYLSPALLSDQIIVATWPGRMERFTALRHHQIVRPADGQTLVRATTTWIYLDLATGRPRRMPAELIATFQPRW